MRRQSRFSVDPSTVDSPCSVREKKRKKITKYNRKVSRSLRQLSSSFPLGIMSPALDNPPPPRPPPAMNLKADDRSISAREINPTLRCGELCILDQLITISVSRDHRIPISTRFVSKNHLSSSSLNHFSSTVAAAAAAAASSSSFLFLFLFYRSFCCCFVVVVALFYFSSYSQYSIRSILRVAAAGDAR